MAIEVAAFLDALKPAVRQAAAIAQALEGRVANRPKVGEETPVKAAMTIADSAAQEAILVALHEHFPDVALRAEEDTPTAHAFPADGEETVVIDPIDGTLHAYGNSCEVVDDWEICDGVLWTSTDGTTWSRDAALEGLDGFMPWTITETDFGYILEGALCPEPWVCPSSLMISTDGLSWVNVHPDDAPSEFTRVTGFGDGVLAIGELYDEFFGEEVRFVAQSPDLEEWSYFEVPPEMGRFGVNDLVAIDGGVVGIGVGDDNEITVWVWEP